MIAKELGDINTAQKTFRVDVDLLEDRMMDVEMSALGAHCMIGEVKEEVARNDCPIYAFFFVFPFLLLFNPHSFIMTSYVLIYSCFSSLTACLYAQYPAR